MPQCGTVVLWLFVASAQFNCSGPTRLAHQFQCSATNNNAFLWISCSCVCFVASYANIFTQSRCALPVLNQEEQAGLATARWHQLACSDDNLYMGLRGSLLPWLAV